MLDRTKNVPQMPSGVPSSNNRVLIVANWDWVLYNFRLPLARALESWGAEVHLVCPKGSYTEAIREQGFNVLEWKLDRKSKNPVKEFSATRHLVRLYKQLEPRAVHHFTIKPILYGSLAARIAKVPNVINNFTGLGYLFSGGLQAKILKPFVILALRWLVQNPETYTAFQSASDFTRLQAVRAASPERSVVIEGTGVDLSKFTPTGKKPGPPIVLMAARLLYDKGVREFVEAAQIVHSRAIQARFWLAGDQDPANPSSIPDPVLQEWKDLGNVTFLGHHPHMEELLREASIAVLPSYHEGVPLFLLEAAASGLPLVGTDIDGVRMIITNKENGLLVPMKKPEALADALQKLLRDSILRKKLGTKSRSIAEHRFAQEKVLGEYRSLYLGLGVLTTSRQR